MACAQETTPSLAGFHPGSPESGQSRAYCARSMEDDAEELASPAESSLWSAAAFISHLSATFLTQSPGPQNSRIKVSNFTLGTREPMRRAMVLLGDELPVRAY